MDEVLATDGAEFSHGEEAGDGDGAEGLVEGGEVVVGGGEEAGAAAVAGEEEGAGGCAGLGRGGLQEGFEVFVGGGGVSDVELDGLADADEVGDGQGA